MQACIPKTGVSSKRSTGRRPHEPNKPSDDRAVTQVRGRHRSPTLDVVVVSLRSFVSPCSVRCRRLAFLGAKALPGEIPRSSPPTGRSFDGAHVQSLPHCCARRAKTNTRLLSSLLMDADVGWRTVGFMTLDRAADDVGESPLNTDWTASNIVLGRLHEPREVRRSSVRKRVTAARRQHHGRTEYHEMGLQHESRGQNSCSATGVPSHHHLIK